MTAGGGPTVVLFRMGPEHYAFATDAVREVLPMRVLTPWPEGPTAVAGLLQHRTTLLPVVDLRTRLGLAVGGEAPTRIIVVASGDDLAGIAVDHVDAVERLSEGAIRDLPLATDRRGAAPVRGVIDHGDHLVLLLDPGAIVRQLGDPARRPEGRA